MSLKGLRVVALTCCALLPASISRPSAQSDIIARLLRYASGAYEAALPTPVDPGQLRRQLSENADRFLASRELSLDRARQVLAAFALEAADSALEGRKIDSPAFARDLRSLLEWACQFVRRHEQPDEFDRRWFVASLAVFEGLLDPLALEMHVAHVEQRFAREPRARLAVAIAGEQWTSPYGLTALQSPTSNLAFTESERQRRRSVASTRLSRLLDEPTLVPEARVRLAHLALDLGRPADALMHLQYASEPADDAGLAYFGHLFRGLALDRLGRMSEAGAEFRAALDIQPGAHAATMSLAAVLFRSGNRLEAHSLIQTVLEREKPGRDPWWTYWMGDMRLVSRRIKTLREGIK